MYFQFQVSTGSGITELLYYVIAAEIAKLDDTPIVFEQEYFPEEELLYDRIFHIPLKNEDDVYVVEGPKIEKMLGYTNLDSEKGFAFLPEIPERHRYSG